MVECLPNIDKYVVMKLSTKQISHLRSLAHALKPVVMIGDKGLTDSVVNEINLALDSHELIKVKVRAEDRESREQMINTITKKTAAERIQQIGHIVTLFRRSKAMKIGLPA